MLFKGTDDRKRPEIEAELSPAEVPLRIPFTGSSLTACKNHLWKLSGTPKLFATDSSVQ